MARMEQIFTGQTRAGASRPWLAWLIMALVSGPAAAQELEPRAYSPNPVGANFLVLSYAYQSGDVLFDPVLPFSDVEARIHTTVSGYGHTFDLFGRTASLFVMIPYGWGSIEGNVGESFTRITRSGLADARLKFTVNLLGGPALPPSEFMARKSGTTLGASITVSAPTGQYDPARFINIGTNRWAVKPELGLSQPLGRWILEGYAGVWFFSDNADSYGGTVRSQDPLATFQGHVAYTFRPRLWLAWDTTYYTGGDYYIDGVTSDSRQANLRAGLTLAIPIGRQHSIKFSVANGVTSRIGSEFTTIGIAYQFFWFSRQKGK